MGAIEPALDVRLQVVGHVLLYQTGLEPGIGPMSAPYAVRNRAGGVADDLFGSAGVVPAGGEKVVRIEGFIADGGVAVRLP